MFQLNRVKAVEKEKDGLEGAKNEAVEFLQTENEIYRKKNMLYQKYLYVANAHVICYCFSVLVFCI